MLSGSPLVSVIMATYNRAHLISYAIESILNQTFADFEFIIVDDGSTDATQSILKKYARQDKRIKLLQHKNQGAAFSRNRAMHSTQGEYIALMDDDDISMPARLTKQLAFLQTHPDLSACICENYNMLNAEGTRLKKKKRKRSRLPRDTISLRTNLALPFILSGRTFIKKKTLLCCNGYRTEFTSAEDLDLSLRFQEKFQAGVVHEFLYKYRVPESHIEMNLSSHNLISALHCHIAAYVSAWYRRNKHFDPLSPGLKPDTLMDFIPQMPKPSQRRILRTITPIIKKFNRISQIRLDEIHKAITIVGQLDNSSPLQRRLKCRQLIPFGQEGRWQDMLTLLRM